MIAARVWRRIVRMLLPDDPKKRRSSVFWLVVLAIGLVLGVVLIGIVDTLFAFAAVIAVLFLLIGQARSMGKAVIMVLLAAAASQSVAAADIAVVGVGHEGRVERTAVPYASGAWGTDYLTVSHLMRADGLQITLDGRRFAPATIVPEAYCSGMAHGIDVVLLRVVAHRDRPTVSWGTLSDLKDGDELRVTPHDLPLVTVRLLHHVFEQWADRGAEEWPAEVSRALVAEAWDLRSTHSGYSGAPWMRNGRAYGIHKATARAKAKRGAEDEKFVALAEPVTRIRECFERMGYRSP